MKRINGEINKLKECKKSRKKEMEYQLNHSQFSSNIKAVNLWLIIINKSRERKHLLNSNNNSSSLKRMRRSLL
jgi:hypothetical protein